MSVLLFAWLLTLVESNIAGRAYAVYGGIYISCSLLWAWLVKGRNQTNGISVAH
ncbi:hypothetical protein [Snodgrassella alvi]|uniref:hypothetical protein n=1 Tax=Snodgrassella alvi TaxID=1196083 RepID=UPI00403C7C88